MSDIFDDFLLDASRDDLDSMHDEDQKLKFGGGLKKLAKKVKQKVKDRKERRNPKAVSDTDAAKVVAVGNSNPKGSKSTVAKKSSVVDKPAAVVKKRVDTSDTDPKINAPKAKTLTVKKTNAPIKTKRKTGKTYKMAWDGMSAAQKSKHKGGFSEFETKAKTWNATEDSKKAAKKGADDSKKRADDGTKKHEDRSEKFKKKLITDTNRERVIEGFNGPNAQERLKNTKDRNLKATNDHKNRAMRYNTRQEEIKGATFSRKGVMNKNTTSTNPNKKKKNT
jgi:hypothetical protein|tara:strand:+ start:22470 stop:23306 length:837 start_codon:yes stop_codon:yes gene_type:complete